MKKIQNQKPNFKSTTTFNSTTGGAACASVCWGLAVGTRRGVVELYDLVDSAALFRSVSLYDWGYSMDDTGAVTCIACTLDNSAFAVGWKLRGLTVWSISGCRLMSTICQIGLSSASSPVVKANQDCKYEPMMGGTSMMHWDEYGYRLHAAEEHTDEFKILHLHLPVSCLSQMAASMDGMYLAVAGLHGLILNKRFSAQACLGWGTLLLSATTLILLTQYELLFYPQYHLNQSSLLCRKPLFAKPVVMDVFQSYLLVTYRPFDVHIFHVKFSCELAPSSTPDLQLSPVGELTDMTAKSHPAAMRFIHDQLSREHVSKNQISTPSDLLGKETVSCGENVIHLAVIGMGGISYLAWGLGQSANKNQTSFPKHVARKTDGRHWWICFLLPEDLTELFEECFQQRWYWTGSLYTYKPPLKFLKASKRLFEVVIAELEDPTVSQYCALCLLQAELDESLYELAGELVRQTRFLGYFRFPCSYRSQSFDSKSLSFKEQYAHVTSVKNILESHASNLMLGKELSKLVAFVKGAQFDLLEYLQRKRYGSACLENFASGIKLIGQKVAFTLYNHKDRFICKENDDQSKDCCRKFDGIRVITTYFVGDPNHVSESGYQGVGPYLEALVAGAGRSYHLAEDAHFKRDGHHALQAVAEIRELLYQAFQVAHRGDRLHYGHYGVHSSAAAPNTSAPSMSAPSTSAPATSAPSTSVTPPHTTPYIFGIPYVPDPDWTPPRYMHDVVTPPT
ncbi:unnamed protein product [Camellia sinensis]